MANYSAGGASVEITPDFRNFVTKLRADLERVEADLGVEIHPDIAEFGRELQAYLDTVVAVLDVEVNPDTTGFAAELDAKLAAIMREFDVRVGVDQASLNQLEALIRAKLAAMDLRVDVQVGADTRVAADELAALKAAYREMTMNVDADTSAAAAQIAGLNGIPVRANVTADRSMLTGLLSEPVLLNVGALGLGALPAAGTLIASIGADVQALTQNIALLPGLFAGAAAGITTLAVGLDGMKDALSDSPEKAAEAYEKMSVDGRKIVDTVREHGEQWSAVGDRIQAITLEGLSEPLDTMLDAQIPALERGMSGMAQQFNGMFRGILGELGNAQSAGALETVFGNSAEAAGVLNGAVTPVINSIRTLATTGSSFLPQLAQNFTDAATRFDAFLTRAEQSGDLARWMDEGIDAAGRLLSVIGNLGSSLSSVFRAVRADGDGFLVTVDRLTERMSNWLASSEGQTELRQFFAEGREQSERWLPILQNMGSVLGTVFEAAQAWSAILLPFLRAGSELLGEHDSILKTVIISYLAFRTIGPIFSALGTAISGATGMLRNFQAAQAAAAGAGAGGLRAGIAGVAGALGSGGIFGIALAGAAIGLGILATKHQEAKAAAAEQEAQLKALGQTLDETTGKATQATLAKQSEQLGEQGFLTRAQTIGVNPEALVRASAGVDPEAQAQINERITGIILEQRESAGATWGRAKASGLSDAEIAQALQGVPEAVDKYRQGIEAAQIELVKMGSEEKLPDLSMLKDALNDVGESAATLGGRMNEASSQTAQLGEQQRQITDAAQGMWALTEEGRAAFDGLGVAVDKVTANTVVLRGATAEQQQAMKDLGYAVTELPDKTVVVTLNDEQARAQVVKLNTEAAAPVTKTVNIVYTGDFVKPEGARQPLQPKAAGGEITGGIPGRDSVPLLAMPGEHMLTTSDVDKLGGQAGVYRFRAALQAGLVKPMAAGGAVEWTPDDEIDLQQAQTAITQAEERAAKVAADPKASDADKRQAQLKVDEARRKAQKLEDKKAGVGGTGGTILPQAELPALRSDDELDIADAEYRIDQANTKRNQVYADPNATDEERAAADRDYIRAQNARQQLVEQQRQRGGSGGAAGSDIDVSLPGIAAKGAGILAEGILSMFGLENSILSGNNVYTRSLNSVLNFYAGKAQEGAQGGGAAGGYDYVPKNLPVNESGVDGSSGGTGASSAGGSGTGGGAASGEIKSAEDYDPAGGVEQWRGTFAAVLRSLAMPLDWLDLGLAQMRTESGGNPKAINLWDSNAAKGTPSKSLMQVIDPTFAAHRSTLYPNDIWDPGANIAASLRYTVSRYGSPVGVWGQGHGYDQGGIAEGIGFMLKQTLKPERVLSPRQTEVFEASLPILESIKAALPTSLPPVPAGMRPRGGDSMTVKRDHGVHFHAPVSVMDMGELVREQDRWAALQAQGVMAGLPG
ncbi:transglycosylase SLT domain-containing protein [Nocardia farcinica]|uniref:lytic transglycosylase domain-containing protein n=1 Tax=Nocardia farcinica TaxID=37329 RepID=UPI00245655C2|nr:transglycosylase SLT domain-containing protein [Nocardia farcinica]